MNRADGKMQALAGTYYEDLWAGRMARTFAKLLVSVECDDSLFFGNRLDLDRECPHQFVEGAFSRSARVPADDYAHFNKIGCREAANPGRGYLR